MGVKEYYDSVIEEIEKYEQELLPKISKKIRTDIIVKYLGSSPKNVLDVGGGSGRYTIELLRNGHFVTLNDLSEKSISLAKRKINNLKIDKNVKYLEGDILNLNLPENYYDFILCEGSTFSYISDAETFLDIAWKSLKADGILYLTASSLYGILINKSEIIKKLLTTKDESKWNYINKSLDNNYIRESEEYDVTLKAYTLDELLCLLKSKNFSYIDSYGRNVWDVLMENEEVVKIASSLGEDVLVDFEKSLHKERGLIDVCHSIAVISRKNEVI